MLRGPERIQWRRYSVTLMVTVALLMMSVAGCGGGSATTRSSTPPASSPAVSTAATSSGTVAGPASRIAVIVLENKEYNQIIGRAGAPYLNALARQGAVAANYYAITHPSLPNYLALTGGSTFGFSGHDCGTCSVSQPNLIDELDAARISWKVYAEDMPSTCSAAVTAGAYARRHDPFLYYRDVANNPTRCRFVVSTTTLTRDLADHSLPRFVWVVPNICNDAHSCSTYTGDRYLRAIVPRLLAELGPSGLLFVTFDEGATNLGCCGVAKGGHVLTLVAGPGARAGARSMTPYDHYSLLRTIEDLWGLPRLAGAALPSTQPMTDLLRVRPVR
jgi:phosphatidylinositol-3-phosphatase